MSVPVESVNFLVWFVLQSWVCSQELRFLSAVELVEYLLESGLLTVDWLGLLTEPKKMTTLT
jgi:hypothetical protein